MVAREPKSKLNMTLKDIMTTISREEIRVKYLTEIFVSEFGINPDYHDTFRIVDINFMRQLDKVVDFYLKEYMLRNPSAKGVYPHEMPTKLHYAALEAQARGKLRNSRDIFILAGYAQELTSICGLCTIKSDFDKLLVQLPDDLRPTQLPNWYKQTTV